MKLSIFISSFFGLFSDLYFLLCFFVGQLFFLFFFSFSIAIFLCFGAIDILISAVVDLLLQAFGLLDLFLHPSQSLDNLLVVISLIAHSDCLLVSAVLAEHLIVLPLFK
jgi:hypothetical protein